jgi:hypothetical protein
MIETSSTQFLGRPGQFSPSDDMVHDGIEYVDMRFIGEAYEVRKAAGLHNSEMVDGRRPSQFPILGLARADVPLSGRTGRARAGNCCCRCRCTRMAGPPCRPPCRSGHVVGRCADAVLIHGDGLEVARECQRKPPTRRDVGNNDLEQCFSPGVKRGGTARQGSRRDW